MLKNAHQSCRSLASPGMQAREKLLGKTHGSRGQRALKLFTALIGWQKPFYVQQNCIFKGTASRSPQSDNWLSANQRPEPEIFR
jgi:hypothetical protein